jgi:hypothetical protein
VLINKAAMSDNVTNGADGNEPWILQESRACAEEPSDAMDKGLSQGVLRYAIENTEFNS